MAGIGFQRRRERRRHHRRGMHVGDVLGVSDHRALASFCDNVSWLCEIGTDRNGGSGDAMCIIACGQEQGSRGAGQ